MPELPEVEIVKQSLKKKIKNKKIIKVVVRNRNLRFKLQSDFEKNLTNRMINQISRIAKYLILIFDNNKYCIIHLGMSGTIHLINNNQAIEMTNLSFYQSKILQLRVRLLSLNIKKFQSQVFQQQTLCFPNSHLLLDLSKDALGEYQAELYHPEMNWKKF